MGHKYKGNAQPLLHFPQDVLHLCTQLQVQRRQRLIQQKHLRLIDDGAGNRHTLSLSA
ncbi:hypothetical protein D3C73_600050 [compost metagenome]